MSLSKPIWLKKLSALAIIVAGCWQFGSGSYIYAKAQFAQYLLNNAWSKTLQGETKVKPWEWADTHPVAKITFNKGQEDYIVLAGGTGRTMAFAPGHVSATPLPGNGGNSVIVGHRDTHFTVLKDLKFGDEIRVQTLNKQINYKVANTFIVDQSQSEVMQDFGLEQLTLITCYPFDAIHTGGPLRYVVQAESI
ncbi:MAG: class GN sortase [Gammaproteobacteria bacterium]|nr:class GN sortase [Gammaproteobacteria bacterium]NNC67579.1 class GN sortase [Gammaproteobacteria bacterium]